MFQNSIASNKSQPSVLQHHFWWNHCF